MSRNRRRNRAFASDEALTAETRRQITAPHPTPVAPKPEPARKLVDPSGLTTGRWKVERIVLVTVGGVATGWVWRALPEAAHGVKEFAIWKHRRDFMTHAAAYAHAYAKAQENLR